MSEKIKKLEKEKDEEKRQRGRKCAKYVAETMKALELEWPFLSWFVRNHHGYDAV